MQKTKKFLSVFLSVVLLLSTFVYSASAAATISGSSTIGVEFEYLDENGNAVTSVQPGQVITVNIYANVNQANQALKAAKFQVWFNSDIYEYVDGTQAWVGPVDYLNPASMTEVITSGTVYNNVYNKLTETEKTYGWNAALYMQFGLDGTVDGSYLIQENADTPMATAQFKVKDSVAPGTAAPLGAPQATTYVKRGAVYNYVQTTDIAVPTKTGVITLTTSGTEFTVTSAAVPVTPLEISHWKNQIRFDKNSKDEFAGTFDARMLMSIDNFDEVFGDVAGAEASVIDAGYIFNKGAAMDVEAAKAQVEGGTATYTQIKNAYVSTYFKAEKAYVMSCMIQNIPEADKKMELSAMAYVIYTDAKGETAYAYSPVVTSTFETLYNNNFSNAFPNG